MLDTTRGTFTKDMILASSITVPFRLSGDELARIFRRIVAIDFWSYPSRSVSHGDGQRFEPPAGMEYETRLTVITEQGSKTVRWSGGYYADDRRAQDLRDLADTHPAHHRVQARVQAAPSGRGRLPVMRE